MSTNSSTTNWIEDNKWDSGMCNRPDTDSPCNSIYTCESFSIIWLVFDNPPVKWDNHFIWIINPIIWLRRLLLMTWRFYIDAQANLRFVHFVVNGALKRFLSFRLTKHVIITESFSCWTKRITAFIKLLRGSIFFFNFHSSTIHIKYCPIAIGWNYPSNSVDSLLNHKNTSY